MKTIISKIDLLDRIKLYYNMKNDAELARFLDISRATLSNWKTRDSIDYDLVFSKCEQIDLEWLLTGRGETSYKDIKITDIPAKNETTSVITERPSEQSAKAEVYYNMYKEKDEEVKAQAEEIGQLKERLRIQEEKIESLKKADMPLQKDSTGSTPIRKRGVAGSESAQFAEQL